MTVNTESQMREESGTSRGSMLVRWGAYISERFPPLGHGLLIFSFYSSNQFLAHALTSPGESMRYDLSTLIGALAILGVFLHLRIFDAFILVTSFITGIYLVLLDR